jgi:hypothetical protein
MDEIAKEIITADELKKYLTANSHRLGYVINYDEMRKAQEEVMKFLVMKENEHVIFILSLMPGGGGSHYFAPVPQNSVNILLTNNGKILYIKPGDVNTSGDYKIVNHDFWIPPDCIYTIKTLYKNISGFNIVRRINPNSTSKYKYIYNSEHNHGVVVGCCNNFKIDAIYKNLNDNLNEYLKHLKTTITKRNEQMAEMESMRLQKEKDALLINEQTVEIERMRILINELINEQVLEHERVKENERIRLQKEKDTLLINLLDMPLENEPIPLENEPILINLLD